MPSTEFLTTNEVAAICRTFPSTVRYWRYVGKGPKSIKPGRAVLYDRRDVDAWLHGLREEASTLVGAGA